MMRIPLCLPGGIAAQHRRNELDGVGLGCRNWTDQDVCLEIFFDIVAIYQWCFGCDFDDCDDDQDDDDDVDVQGQGIQQMDLAVLLLLSSGPSLTRRPTR